jgi:hypothetical protein
MGVPDMLTGVADPIPFFQVFATRYRNGSLAPSGQPVRSRTVEAALRSIGQTMASMGAPDLRLNLQGKLHYILQQQLKGYAREDAPASRVKPIPFLLIDHTVTHASTTFDQATADIAILGFFFLLRPGEHTISSTHSDTQPFRLCDVNFRLGSTTSSAATGDLDLIGHSRFATLTFTKQKNGTENEIVGHARSGHVRTCPVLALIRRTLHLRQHHAPPSTPLCTVFLNRTSTTISATALTSLLRLSAAVLFPTLGFLPTDISARALRAGGAMALLCAQVDSDVIKLLGRWRSDEMLRYLHLQAYPKMHTFAQLMVANGDFRLLSRPPPPP